ncbi:MAG: histidine phosphatase family protein [Anaerolineales bacterium]|jgi:probable phosphomutase (TIGR03848 family)
MPTILLVRHAENEYLTAGRMAGRLNDIHLNENGRRQAHELAENLAQWPVKAVFSSPLERTMETAQPIAQAQGLRVIPREGLLEIDVGEWQDKTLKSLRRRKLWRNVQFSPSRVSFPGGESLSNAQQRIVADLETIRISQKPRDLVVCVSHSDPIKLAIAYYAGIALDLFQRIIVSPASVSALQFGETSVRLLMVNYQFSINLKKI